LEYQSRLTEMQQRIEALESENVNLRSELRFEQQRQHSLLDTNSQSGVNEPPPLPLSGSVSSNDNVKDVKTNDGNGYLVLMTSSFDELAAEEGESKLKVKDNSLVQLGHKTIHISLGHGGRRLRLLLKTDNEIEQLEGAILIQENELAHRKQDLVFTKEALNAHLALKKEKKQKQGTAKKAPLEKNELSLDDDAENADIDNEEVRLRSIIEYQVNNVADLESRFQLSLSVHEASTWTFLEPGRPVLVPFVHRTRPLVWFQNAQMCTDASSRPCVRLVGDAFLYGFGTARSLPEALRRYQLAVDSNPQARHGNSAFSLPEKDNGIDLQAADMRAVLAGVSGPPWKRLVCIFIEQPALTTFCLPCRWRRRRSVGHPKRCGYWQGAISSAITLRPRRTS
jgi:hypothetical protein